MSKCWILILLVASASQANILPALDRETVDVLPKGVVNARLKNIRISIADRFDGSGRAQALAEGLNRQVTVGELSGTTRAQVDLSMAATVPVLTVGASDRLSLGFAIPVVRVAATVQTGFQQSPESQAITQQLCTATPDVCQQTKARLEGLLNQQVTSLGYDPLESRSFTQVGDIRAFAKYSIASESEQQLTVKSGLILPTGRVVSPDDLTNLHTGKGRFLLDVTGVYARNLLMPDLKWTAYAGFQYEFADHPELRIPTAESSLTPDKEKLRRSGTLEVHAGTSLGYSVRPIGTTFGVGYDFQRLGSPNHEGSRFSPDRYQLVNEEYPTRVLHSGYVFLGFSTIEWYRRKSFGLPLELVLSYSRSLGGRNNWKSNLVSADFVLYL